MPADRAADVIAMIDEGTFAAMLGILGTGRDPEEGSAGIEAILKGHFSSAREGRFVMRPFRRSVRRYSDVGFGWGG